MTTDKKQNAVNNLNDFINGNLENLNPFFKESLIQNSILIEKQQGNDGAETQYIRSAKGMNIAAKLNKYAGFLKDMMYIIDLGVKGSLSEGLTYRLIVRYMIEMSNYY